MLNPMLEPHKCFIDEITHIEEEHPIAIASQSAESHSITMDWMSQRK